jgi:uncharacterized protein (TIGR00251 family)
MRIAVKVIPVASKDQIIKIDDINFKIKTTKPPEDGKANESVIEILAKHFEVRKSQIEIISGATSQKKIIQINS